MQCDVQGPPGTGKTSSIIAIISALLVKHYVPPNPKAKPCLPGPPSNSPPQDLSVPPSSSSSLPTVKAKRLLPLSSSSTGPRADPSSSSSEQRSGNSRAGPGCAPAPAPKFRILVCAQSNAAIDEVIARLASPGLLMGESRPASSN